MFREPREKRRKKKVRASKQKPYMPGRRKKKKSDPPIFNPDWTGQIWVISIYCPNPLPTHTSPTRPTHLPHIGTILGFPQYFIYNLNISLLIDIIISVDLTGTTRREDRENVVRRLHLKYYSNNNVMVKQTLNLSTLGMVKKF